MTHLTKRDLADLIVLADEAMVSKYQEAYAVRSYDPELSDRLVQESLDLDSLKRRLKAAWEQHI